MPANTPKGLPYPLPSEPVAEGAQAIRNLAEAVDTRLRYVVIDDYVLSSTLNVYDTNVRLGTDAIPQTYRDLVLRVSGMIDNATEQSLVMGLNGAGSGYFYQGVQAANVGANGFEGINVAFAQVGWCGSSGGRGFTCEIVIPNYGNPSGGLNSIYWTSQFYGSWGGASGQHKVGQAGGQVALAAGVKRIVLDQSGTTNFAAQTRFTLYGRG